MPIDFYRFLATAVKMNRTPTLVLGFLFVVSLGVIGLMANQLKENKDSANGGESPVVDTSSTDKIAHNPPSLDDVPDGPIRRSDSKRLCVDE